MSRTAEEESMGGFRATVAAHRHRSPGRGHRPGLLSGWGRFPTQPGVEVVSEDLREVTEGAVLTRGLGRSYGDASLPPPGRGPVASSRLADRILGFDSEAAILRCEAGLSLAALHGVFLQRGFSCPVVPGTAQVTVGGMVASDVHGKNHHVRGCFGEHVLALRMRVADGRELEVTPESDPGLFWATIGGMGLTGHILEVSVRLERIPTPWIRMEQQTARDLDELLERLVNHGRTWPFSVAWVDALARGAERGRGVLIVGRWADQDEAPRHAPRGAKSRSVPFEAPGWLLNAQSVGAFNALYYRLKQRRGHPSVVDPWSFFHPLDALANWNLLYGRLGFTQYQCVIPDEGHRSGCRRIFDTLARHGGASYLCVIKDCGPTGRGMLSFPMHGISVALDIRVAGDATRRLVDDLNAVVADAGGRVYLTKDALTRVEHFRVMEPRLDGWNRVRRQWDPENRITSALARRLLGDGT